MTDQQINEAMAKLDGWTSEEVTSHDSFPYGGTATYTRWTSPTGVRSLGTRTFSYTTDHNACQPVIDGLSENESLMYAKHLAVIVGDEGAASSRYTWFETIALMLKATPRQKCEATLKAKGLWHD